MKNFYRLIVMLLVISLVPFAALAESTSDITPESTPAATNGDGQSYVLDYFQDTPLDVSKYKGKALYLNVFTGWCYYCMQEMPDIKKLYDTYDPSEVEIILIHAWSGEDATDSAAVVEKYSLQALTLVEDDQMELVNLIGLTGYPTSLFIDKNGYLAAYQSGQLTYESMASMLDQMGVSKRDTGAADSGAATGSAVTARTQP
jgi:thiol-disulfide isomerase/thioredoxin